MTNIIKTSAIALSLAFLALPVLTGGAHAKSAFMQQCSTRYQAAKAAGTVAAGTKWTDYMKSDCADLKSSAASATTPLAPATAKPVSSPRKVSSTNSPNVPKANTAAQAGGSFMQNCSATWKQMKDSQTVPAGTSWKDFVKAGCNVQDSAATAEEQSVPADPAASNSVDLSSIAVKTTDKNGKPFTAGQIALHQRMKECGSEWRSDKSAGSLPVGEKWPQFWSACNTRLKTNQG